jgi:hypothetical protein
VGRHGGRPILEQRGYHLEQLALVELASVSMYSGVAYTIDVSSLTSRKFLSAWTPPDVAQAPIVTSFLERARICLMRSAS